jgi:hypothetical protein
MLGIESSQPFSREDKSFEYTRRPGKRERAKALLFKQLLRFWLLSWMEKDDNVNGANLNRGVHPL